MRLIDHGRAGQNLKKWLVVSDVPLDRYGEAAINAKLSDLDWVSRAAVAHEAVVESFGGASGDRADEAVHDLQRRRPRYGGLRRRRTRSSTPRCGGCEAGSSLGVRVSLDRDRPQPLRPPGVPTPAPRTWQARKRSAIGPRSSLGTHARWSPISTKSLSAIASDAVRRAASELPAQGGPLLLDAAFLVPRTGAARFRKVVERRAKELEPDGYRVAMTGPWPPYSFVRD